jgi:hypothetical protein
MNYNLIDLNVLLKKVKLQIPKIVIVIRKVLFGTNICRIAIGPNPTRIEISLNGTGIMNIRMCIHANGFRKLLGSNPATSH